MATGPVNSQSNAAAAPAPVLRSGETVTSTASALKDADAKTYYHTVPGARFIMPNGLEVRFMGGMFVSSDKEICEELDKIANKGSSQIYTKSEAKIAAGELQKLAAADAAKQQAPVLK